MCTVCRVLTEESIAYNSKQFCHWRTSFFPLTPWPQLVIIICSKNINVSIVLPMPSRRSCLVYVCIHAPSKHFLEIATEASSTQLTWVDVNLKIIAAGGCLSSTSAVFLLVCLTIIRVCVFPFLSFLSLMMTKLEVTSQVSLSPIDNVRLKFVLLKKAEICAWSKFLKLLS